MDLTDKTDEELTALVVALEQERADLKERVRAVSVERGRRCNEANDAVIAAGAATTAHAAAGEEEA